MRMLNKNRKGVSEVIANVLIVLLVIVGIAVIWSVVKPTIDKGAQGIKTQSDCLGLSVEPVSCIYDTDASSATAKIKRNPGAGNFESVDIVFTGNDGTSKVHTFMTTQDNLDELSTADVTATGVGGLTTPVKVSVAVRSGGQLCPVLSEPVTCTLS